MANRYALELQALAATLAVPAGDDAPTLLVLDQEAAELLLGFERDLEPRLAAGSGDLAHLSPARPKEVVQGRPFPWQGPEAGGRLGEGFEPGPRLLRRP